MDGVMVEWPTPVVGTMDGVMVEWPTPVVGTMDGVMVEWHTPEVEAYTTGTEQRSYSCWLLFNVPATGECILGTDLLRQFYVLPH